MIKTVLCLIRQIPARINRDIVFAVNYLKLYERYLKSLRDQQNDAVPDLKICEIWPGRAKHRRITVSGMTIKTRTANRFNTLSDEG